MRMWQVVRSPLVIIGLLLVGFALLISRYLSHDLAHSVGMGGLVVLLTEIFRHGARFRYTTLGLPLLKGVAYLIGGVTLIATMNNLGYLNRDIASFAAIGVVLVIAFSCLAGLLFEMLGPKHPAPVAALIVLAASVFWELIYQPSVAVYFGPARGWVQGWQVLADFIGVFAAYLPLRNLKLHLNNFKDRR